MIDRARAIRTAELNDDRLQSLGRVASGLAHELNNPASAATRFAQSLTTLLTEAEDAARGLAAARLSDATFGTAATASCTLLTMKPLTPSRNTSLTEPQSKAMVGVPQDIASIMHKPNGSGQSIGNTCA